MTRTALSLVLAVALLAGAQGAARLSAQVQQTPMFRSTVDLVAVDVQVVGREGVPVDGLGIDDFEVSVNGHKRRLVSVDFIRKRPVLPPDAGGPDLPISTPGYIAPGTRVFVIAIDTSSFAVGDIKPHLRAAQRFVTGLQADDMVALYVYPFEEPTLNLTHDHRAVSRALDRVMGALEPFNGFFHLSASEVVDITANDADVVGRVVSRECPPNDPLCPSAVRMEASAQAAYFEGQAMRGLTGLSLLLEGLAKLPGRKTAILISGGLVAGDRGGGRPDLGDSMRTVAAEASAAETILYVLHMDDSFFEPFSAANKAVLDPSDRFRTASRDSYLRGSGLDRLIGTAGGALLRVQAGTGDYAFDRVLRESEAYYLLGVQPTVEDRDGKLHFLSVKVKRRGVTVRSRTHVVIPAR